MMNIHAVIINGLAKELGWLSEPLPVFLRDLHGEMGESRHNFNVMCAKYWNWSNGGGHSCVTYIDDGWIVIFDSLLYRENERNFAPNPIRLELCNPNLIESLRKELNEYCVTRRR